MMSDSTRRDFQRTALKEWVKRRVLGLAGSALVAGKEHEDYLVGLGVPGEKIFHGYDVVDNHHFTVGARLLRQSARPSHLPVNHYFLASSRFLPRKNLLWLLDVYGAYRQVAGAEPWDLVILGDGELADSLKARILTLGLSSSVHLPGFIQYEKLPEYYAFAGVFIHASTTEQWGLVVNEAMASGLPVLVSDRCGCASSLVKPGANGFTFDPHDKNGLLKLMLQLTTGNADLYLMGKQSLAIIESFSPAAFASGLASAAEHALSGGTMPARLFDRFLLWALLLK